MNDLQELNAIELFERSKSLDVNNDLDAERASNFLGECAKCKKIVEDYKDEKVRPQKRILADIEAKCREAIFPVNEADKIVRVKLANYMDRVREQKKAEFEERRLAQLESIKAHLSERESDEILNGTPDTLIPLVQASVNALENTTADQMRQTIRTGESTVAQSLVWEWEITDSNLIPRDLLVVDQKKVNALCKAGYRDIAGIRFFQTSRVSMR